MSHRWPFVRRSLFHTLSACLFTVICSNVFAEDAVPAASSDWKGWLGAGPVIFPRYTGGKGYDVLPLPLPSITYRDVLFLDVSRAGAYVWSTDDRKAALALTAEARWGRGPKDASLLAGTERRRASVEGGPSFEWDTGLVEVGLSYLHDLTGASRGGAWRAGIGKDVINEGRVKLALHAALERVDSKINNYYFGVRAAEATPTRSAYRAPAGTDVLYGFDGSYALDKRHSIVFGANVTRLSAAAAASPVIEKRNVIWGWLGYAWNF